MGHSQSSGPIKQLQKPSLHISRSMYSAALMDCFNQLEIKGECFHFSPVYIPQHWQFAFDNISSQWQLSWCSIIKLSHCYSLNYQFINISFSVSINMLVQRWPNYGVSLGLLDLSHKSHNAPVQYPTIHQFVTEMCTRVCTFQLQSGALWDICLMHCWICKMDLIRFVSVTTHGLISTIPSQSFRNSYKLQITPSVS